MATHDIHSWRAWYAGGVRYDSRQHSWRELPGVGCIVLLVYRRQQYAPGKHYRFTCSQTDCIGLKGDFLHQASLGDWTGRIHPELRDKALAEFPDTDPEDWKLGIAVPDDEFTLALEEAVAEVDPP